MRKDTILAANLSYLRKQRGATQDTVCSVVGCPRSCLSGYETGAAEPPMDTLVRLSRYYGVSIDRMLRMRISMMDINVRMAVQRRSDEARMLTQLNIVL